MSLSNNFEDNETDKPYDVSDEDLKVYESLSDKIYKVEDDAVIPRFVIDNRDVKEAVRELKKLFNDEHPEDSRALMFHQSLILEKIDEIFGEKLV